MGENKHSIQALTSTTSRQANQQHNQNTEYSTEKSIQQ